MLKRYFSLSFALLLVSSIILNTGLAAVFSDVNNNTTYNAAINDLFERGIIQGYPDNTFRPNNTLNRAELTKIIVESTGVAITTPNNCFPDVPNEEWFAKYVCTAKLQGWIEGYPDNTFQPARTINRAEATKIISLAEGLELTTPSSEPFSDTPINQWYTQYVLANQEKNYLPFKFTFLPGQGITRGEFTEIYHRILVTEDNNADSYKPEFSESSSSSNNQNNNQNTDTPEQNQNPNSDATTPDIVSEDDIQTTEIINGSIDNGSSFTYTEDTFDKVVLNQNLPKTFYKNEVYMIEGEITQGNYNNIFAFIFPVGNNQDTTIFRTTVGTNDSFSIPVHFKTSGDYYIGIIPGDSGSSKIAPITVQNSIPSSTTNQNAAAASNINLSFTRDLTSVNFNATANARLIEFSQGSRNVTYFSRQAINSIPVNYADFVNFNEGSVNVQIQTAIAESIIPLSDISNWTISSTETITATTHQFSEVASVIDISSLPNKFTRNQSLTIAGATSTNLQTDMSIIQPNGQVESVNSGQNSIGSGSNFSFIFTPKTSGTHIVEVNDTTGIAVINHPIYEQGYVPLIPDFFDLNALKLEPGVSINESTEVNQLLSLINQARNSHGLSSVTLDSSLNSLAVSHNQDMISNNYFAHINLEGETPNDRRLEFDILTPVGENIARTTSTRHGHEGLMRSAIHRANILNPNWTRVGISVRKNSDGYFFITEEFSNTLDFVNDAIISAIDNGRSTPVARPDDLDTVAQNWSDRMVDDGFVDTSFGGTSIFDTLPAEHPYTQLKVFIVASNDTTTLIDELLSSEEITSSSWPNLGFGIAIDENGLIKVTALLGK